TSRFTPLPSGERVGSECLPVHEEVRIFPRQLSQEKIGASFVEPKALVLAHDPGLQLLVDVVSQSGQGRGTEATVVTDPPAKERIDVLGDFSQQLWLIFGDGVNQAADLVSG